MKKLTINEIIEVRRVIDEVISILEYDEDLTNSNGEKTYSDGGRFLYSISEDDLNTLKNINWFEI